MNPQRRTHETNRLFCMLSDTSIPLASAQESKRVEGNVVKLASLIGNDHSYEGKLLIVISARGRTKATKQKASRLRDYSKHRQTRASSLTPGVGA
jgi:hypothetical protein